MVGEGGWEGEISSFKEHGGFSVTLLYVTIRQTLAAAGERTSKPDSFAFPFGSRLIKKKN